MSPWPILSRRYSLRGPADDRRVDRVSDAVPGNVAASLRLRLRSSYCPLEQILKMSCAVDIPKVIYLPGLFS